MRIPRLFRIGLLAAACFAFVAQPISWAAASSPLEGLVSANGVHLQYLDWGGSGPTVIFLHGMADNPHIFDDLAPRLTDRFHVIAYARRGSASSDAKAPYDVDTLTEDLRGLMDALGIEKASLVGHSAGGDEITDFAATYPQRVERIVYFDSGYDWSEPEFAAAFKELPTNVFERPSSAMASLDAFRSYEHAIWFPDLDDMRRVESQIRESVVIQSDGSLTDRVPKDVVTALYSALWSNKRRDYSRVHCPALAIYADRLYPAGIGSPEMRRSALNFERAYWQPLQEKSISRIQKELPNVKIARSPGAHTSFFLTDREHVVAIMRRFLGETSTS